MVIVVTRNVEGRVRGFLASTMLEIASGVYTSPTMNQAVRERVWAVLEKWDVGSRADSAIMTWRDTRAPGGQAVLVLGEAPIHLTDVADVVLARRKLGEEELRSLTSQLDPVPF